MKPAEVIIKINGRDFLVKEGDEIIVARYVNERILTIEQIRDGITIRESSA